MHFVLDVFLMGGSTVALVLCLRPLRRSAAALCRTQARVKRD